MKSFFKWVLILTTVVFIFFFGIIFLISSMLETQPQVLNNSNLYIPLSGSIPDYIPPDALEEFLGKTKLDLKKIRDCIEKAAVDDRINGVILEIGFLQTGYGKIQELHEIISEYRLSGKKIYAFLETGLTKEYYLSLACDSVFMPPNSNLFIHGINSEVTFYKRFFDKLGIEAEFMHAGQYKNAPDRYTRDSMSPSEREILQNVIDNYFTEVVTKISEYRGLDIDHVKYLINNVTGFTGTQALEHGLIDGTCFFSDVSNRLNFSGKKSVKLHASDYAYIPASSLKIRNDSNIAVIHISGTISSGGDSEDPFFGQLTGASRIVNDLNHATSSRLIKAIILRIDSPGGSAIASEIILDAVVKAKSKKPVIASIADYGASGGYLVALGADSIVSNANSLVGSIGVFAGKFNIVQLYNKLGLTSERVSHGDNSGLFSIMKPWTPGERAIIERLINNYYVHFKEAVSSSRGLSMEHVESLAQGRVWTGLEGYKAGLLDSTGSIYTAIGLAKRRGGIPDGESARLIYYPKERSFLNKIFNWVDVSELLESPFNKKKLTFIQHIQSQPLTITPFFIIWN